MSLLSNFAPFQFLSLVSFSLILPVLLSIVSASLPTSEVDPFRLIRYCFDDECLTDSFDCVAPYNTWFSVAHAAVAYLSWENQTIRICDRILLQGGVEATELSCITSEFPRGECTVLAFEQSSACSRPLGSLRSYASRLSSNVEIPQTVTFTYGESGCDSYPLALCIRAREADMGLKSLSDATATSNETTTCQHGSLSAYLGPSASHNSLTYMTLSVGEFLFLPISLGWASVWGAFGVTCAICFYLLLCCAYTTYCSKWHKRKKRYVGLRGVFYAASARRRLRSLLHMIAGLVLSVLRTTVWCIGVVIRAINNAEDLSEALVIFLFAVAEGICAIAAVSMLLCVPRCNRASRGLMPDSFWILVAFFFLAFWGFYLVEVSLTFGTISMAVAFRSVTVRRTEFFLLVLVFVLQMFDLVAFSVVDSVVQLCVKFEFDQKGCFRQMLQGHEWRAFEDLRGVSEGLVETLERVMNFVWSGNHIDAEEIIDNEILWHEIPERQIYAPVPFPSDQELDDQDFSDGMKTGREMFADEEVVDVMAAAGGEHHEVEEEGESRGSSGSQLLTVEVRPSKSVGRTDRQIRNDQEILEAKSGFCYGWSADGSAIPIEEERMERFKDWFLRTRIKNLEDRGVVFDAQHWVDETRRTTRCGSIYKDGGEVYYGGLYCGMKMGFGLEGVSTSGNPQDVVFVEREASEGNVVVLRPPYRMGIFCNDRLHGIAIEIDKHNRRHSFIGGTKIGSGYRLVPQFVFSRGAVRDFDICFDRCIISESSSGAVYTVPNVKPNADVAKLGIRWEDVVIKIFKVEQNFRAVGSIPLHPHLMRIHGTVYTDRGVIGIVTERLRETVAELVASPFRLDEVDDDEREAFRALKYRVIRQTAEGLAALHSAFVCHTDMTWDNVMFDRDDSVKLIDFPVGAESFELFWRMVADDVRTFAQMIVHLLHARRGAPLLKSVQISALHLLDCLNLKNLGLLWLRDIVLEMLKDGSMLRNEERITMREVVDVMKIHQFGE